METALELDDASGGLFLHTTLEERRDILDSFFDDYFFSTNHSEPRQEESTSSHESLSTPESEPSSSTSQYSSVEPSPEPRTPKEEEIRPSEFSSRFKDDPSENIQNTLNHLGTISLRNRCVFIRPSMDFPDIHLQWIGRKRQGVLPKQFRLAQPPRPSLVL